MPSPLSIQSLGRLRKAWSRNVRQSPAKSRRPQSPVAPPRCHHSRYASANGGFGRAASPNAACRWSTDRACRLVPRSSSGNGPAPPGRRGHGRPKMMALGHAVPSIRSAARATSASKDAKARICRNSGRNSRPLCHSDCPRTESEECVGVRW